MWSEANAPAWAKSQLQKNVTKLRSYIAKCKCSDVTVEVKRGGNDGLPVRINIAPKDLGGGDGRVANGGPDGINWNIGDSGSPNILPHELGHAGGYRNTKTPGPVIGPDGKPVPGQTNENHSGDPESLMWPITQPINGTVDEEWCKAIESLAK